MRKHLRIKLARIRTNKNAWSDVDVGIITEPTAGHDARVYTKYPLNRWN